LVIANQATAEIFNSSTTKAEHSEFGGARASRCSDESLAGQPAKRRLGFKSKLRNSNLSRFIPILKPTKTHRLED